ncbi:unnamed protein product [Symbiodinium sp. CCMP2592]|nr:unnamed protein product [Symbiodinium sp. CCMP2592]CAE7816255.1 unnamed protein product [Symbiodinium sp. CCMP2592]
MLAWPKHSWQEAGSHQGTKPCSDCKSTKKNVRLTAGDDVEKKKNKGKDHKDRNKKHKKRSASSSSDKTSAESVEEGMAELVSIFGLPGKEYQRNSKQARAEDLSAKQIAVAITNVTAVVTSDEVMEIGGDTEALLTQTSNRVKKSKHKGGEAEAITQARAASMRWKKRLGKNKLSKTEHNSKIETELANLKQEPRS